MEFVHGEPNTQIRLDEDGFHFHHLIDTGGFGFVFLASRKTTQVEYALKVQPLEFMAQLTTAGGHRKTNEASLQMEKTALILCRGHPFIVSLEYSFHTSLYAVLALEYVPGESILRVIYALSNQMWSHHYTTNPHFTNTVFSSGGTLSRLISQSPQARLPCDLARIYTAEIALALNFMHEKGIIYRGT